MMASFRHVSRLRTITSSLGHYHGYITSIPTAGHIPTRQMSNIRLEKEKDFAILYLSKKPVNSYTRASKEEFTAAISEVEADPAMHGLIITSDVPKIFSAGLELTEFYQKSPESIRQFTDTIMQNWLALYGSRLTTIAAINGHALAGGAVTTLLCDYRIIGNGSYTIGLNEAQRDLVLPPWLQLLLVNTVGPREAERGMTLGIAYKPEDALRVGFVDEVVDQDKIMDRAREEMEAYLKITHTTRVGCKQQLRRALVDQLREGLDANSKALADQVNTPEAQENMGKFMNRKK